MLLKTGDFKVKGGLVELTDDSENPTFFLAVRLLRWRRHRQVRSGNCVWFPLCRKRNGSRVHDSTSDFGRGLCLWYPGELPRSQLLYGVYLFYGGYHAFSGCVFLLKHKESDITALKQSPFGRLFLYALLDRWRREERRKSGKEVIRACRKNFSGKFLKICVKTREKTTHILWEGDNG